MRINEEYEQPEERDNYTPLPDGWYSVRMVSCELQQTRAGGTMLHMRLDVDSGQYQGRVIWHNVTMRNRNEDAVRIGKEERARICLATGLSLKLNDTDEWLGRPCEVKLRTRQNEGYEPQNEVRGWRPIQRQAMPHQQRQDVGPGAQSVRGPDAALRQAAKFDDEIPF